MDKEEGWFEDILLVYMLYNKQDGKTEIRRKSWRYKKTVAPAKLGEKNGK